MLAALYKNFSRHFDHDSMPNFFLKTFSSELLFDDNAVTHVMCIANLNLLEDSVATYDERVVD